MLGVLPCAGYFICSKRVLSLTFLLTLVLLRRHSIDDGIDSRSRSRGIPVGKFASSSSPLLPWKDIDNEALRFDRFVGFDGFDGFDRFLGFDRFDSFGRFIRFERLEGRLC